MTNTDYLETVWLDFHRIVFRKSIGAKQLFGYQHSFFEISFFFFWFTQLRNSYWISQNNLRMSK